MVICRRTPVFGPRMKIIPLTLQMAMAVAILSITGKAILGPELILERHAAATPALVPSGRERGNVPAVMCNLYALVRSKE